MEPFEYIVVLSSLILGLGITQILTGVSDLLAQYKVVKFSVSHSIYILIVFIIHIQEWWYSYQYSIQIEVWTLPTAMSIMLFPIILFLQARLLFPTGGRTNDTDMVAYYGENWRWLFSFGAVTIIISIWHNITFSGFSIFDQEPQLAYLTAYIVFIAFNIKGFYPHLVFLILQLGSWGIYFFLDTAVLK